MFLLVVGAVGAPACLHAAGSLREEPHAPVLAALTGVFLAAMAGVLLARDVVGFLMSWELMTLAPAAAILVVGADPERRATVIRYLSLTHVGGAGTWIALLLLADAGAVGAPGLGEARPGLTGVVAAAALVGFGTKAGVVPMHTWLPRAHPVAPTHMSAVMSGAMVAVALYGLVRVLWEWIGPAPAWLPVVLVGLGLAGALTGILLALAQRDLKRLLAYSTIENVGVVLLALGAALALERSGEAEWASLALAAALLHTISHALAKGVLFLGSGAVKDAAGTLDLDRIGGLLRRAPVTGWTLLAGCLAIAGVPPLAGFASEWLAIQSLVRLGGSADPGWAALGAVGVMGLAIAVALSLLCFTAVIGLTLLGPPRVPREGSGRDPGGAARGALLALTAAGALLALVPGLVLPALAAIGGGDVPRGPGLDVPGTGGLPTLGLVVMLGALGGLLALLRGRGKAAPAPVWTCGQPVVPELSWSIEGAGGTLRLAIAALVGPPPRAGRPDAGAPASDPVERVATRAVTGGRRMAERITHVQSGGLRAHAAWLIGVTALLLALARAGVLG